MLVYDYQSFENNDPNNESYGQSFIRRLSEIFLIDSDPHKNLASTSNQLKPAFFAALLNFLLGFIVSGFEHVRYEQWLHYYNYTVYTVI